ncbi:MAG: PASTA domain-containing protein [Erysipelotrichales bacterium]|nr:PASTA domain-containing protein [Erysipelotrichales bacterium]MBQ2310775.1 PASTA domain-containing protein [Erysipelotrichales bacterium]MBQ2478235.1 PASTA domain-containing protein [Erysipelotrichales bacterium]MBQ4374358.1 PASTA domain-containing protein [Erysipelotrichales bacterium]
MNKRKIYEAKKANQHLAVFTAIFAVIGALLTVNVLLISVAGFHFNSGTDITNYGAISVTRQTIYARRGYIFDRFGNVIAEDSTSYSVFAYLDESRPGYEGTPAYVPQDKKEEYAQILGEILDAPPEDILYYLNLDLYQTEFGMYGRGIDKATKDKIVEMGLYGIEFTEHTSRHYPLGAFASHLVGYSRYSEDDDVVVGEMGIEQIFNDYLMGKNGYTRYNQDASGFQLIGTQSEYVAAKNGNNIYLTLDKTCQEGLDVLIDQLTKQFYTIRVWGGVMEVETGRMLAWDCWPTFDPNILDIENYLDYGSEMEYEPGSTMKSFTYAAAIDSGNYDHNWTYYDKGYFNIGVDSQGHIFESGGATSNGTVYNARGTAYGEVTLDQAYYRSMNVGIANVLTHFITPQILEQYLERFGFFQRVNTDAVNDASGSKNMYYGGDMVSTGYGQASSVTALQMFQAYSAILRDGSMVKPYFIDRIENSYNGQVIYQGKTEIVGSPISASTAQQMRDLMRGVVADQDYGTGKYYNLPNIEIIAKTGTGQVATEYGYSSTLVTSSAVIGIPYNDPKIMYYMCIQAPYSELMNYQVDNVKQYLQKLVQYLDLSDHPEGEERTPEEHIVDPSSSYKNAMPELVNHSLSYVDSVLNTYHIRKVMIGNGTSVIKQYPAAGELITQNGRAFLLTSTDHFTMPDMSGWSRKDVTAFWQLTGLSVQVEGYGYVVEQNIRPGEAIDASSEITVRLDNAS